jgi:hypothetical protein
MFTRLGKEPLPPDQDWISEIEKAVEAADVMIVFLSERSVSQEGFPQRRLRYALDVALKIPGGTMSRRATTRVTAPNSK